MAEYQVDRHATGINGLDNMFGGGVPKNSITLLCGGLGVGKTISTLQYMMTAVARDEPLCLCILGRAHEQED
jgi:circadian clock protein KaiC